MNTTDYFAIFYVSALYYVPHFLPVADEMRKRGLSHAWIFSDKSNINSSKVAEGLGLNLINGTPEAPGASADFFIFGNSYDKLTSVQGITVLIYHGIGTKACYYDRDLSDFNIRFVEGDYRKRELDSRSPGLSQERPVVGFSKLDPAAIFSQADREKFLTALGLDPSLKTVLYSPTYYPSSIEFMNSKFPDDCNDLNIIVKPHQFSYMPKYKKQMRVMEAWNKKPNVYLAKLEDFNLLPFFAVSDAMISDESSAIFEYAALGKPVVRNRFVKLRLSYRLFPWKLRKRMDQDIERYSLVAKDAHNYEEMIQLLREVLAKQWANTADIERYSHELVGDVDGKVSTRIVDYLISHKKHYND
jgi:hypothetical protein